MQNPNQPPILEITIISAQGLTKKPSLLFSRRLRPFVTLTATGKHVKTYRTKWDEKGGVNPTWGDKFKLPLDQTFFYQRCPGVHLQLYTKRLLMGPSRLGWCLIPAADLVCAFPPAWSTRFLSYRLRDWDGSRGHGVVNVSVRMEGSVDYVMHQWRPLICGVNPNLQGMYQNDQSSVTGIPVKL